MENEITKTEYTYVDPESWTPIRSKKQGRKAVRREPIVEAERRVIDPAPQKVEAIAFEKEVPAPTIEKVEITAPAVEPTEIENVIPKKAAGSRIRNLISKKRAKKAAPTVASEPEVVEVIPEDACIAEETAPQHATEKEKKEEQKQSLTKKERAEISEKKEEKRDHNDDGSIFTTKAWRSLWDKICFVLLVAAIGIPTAILVYIIAFFFI